MRNNYFRKSFIAVFLASALCVSTAWTISAADTSAMAEAPVPATEFVGEAEAEDPILSDSDWPSSDSEEIVLSDNASADTEGCAAEVPEPAGEDSESEEADGSETSSEIEAADVILGTDDSVSSDTIEDPTVEESEEASYYDEGSGNTSDVYGAPYSPFPDVKDPTHAYYAATCWAGNNGLAKGYSDGTFRSANECTRSEAMMFIWRFLGKPEPRYVSQSPFPDVPMKHPHYKAILWAKQNVITKGYPDGTFGLDRKCTRGEIMMFLWRAAGQPAPSACAKSPFSDVSSTHAYYKAICWGSEQGITKGYSDGSFGINKYCTRGQIVTFLYRFFLNEFYTVKVENSNIMSISSPVTFMNDANYVSVLTTDKIIVSIPTVPQKVLFIGNSLLQGLGSASSGGRFGMCATDSAHDYYHFVTEAILAENPDAEFAKMSGTAFEGCTDTGTADNWYSSKQNVFSADLDLIVIQLGDNVNTDEKKAAFKKNVSPFLMKLKADCPNARIIFVATWYWRKELMKSITDACKANCCDFIYISDIKNSSTVPSKGTVITFNDGTTAIASGGSLSHPNDLGMELIADRIIDMLRLG